MTALAEDVQRGIDPHEFRGLLRRQASTVAVVTVPGPAGFTATSFTSVSLRPQLVSFALDRDSSSWPAVQAATHVAVHLLRRGQHDVARVFATSGVDRFALHPGWRTGPYRLPLLDGVLGIMICAVAQRVPAGDHALVLGTPLAAHQFDGEPLLYHMGGYAGVSP